MQSKCVQNIIGRDRQRKTTVQFDRIMQRKVKVDRHRLASSVKAEIASELGIIIFEQIVHCGLNEVGLKGRIARKKPYIVKANRIKRVEYAQRSRQVSGITCCRLMKVDLTCLDPRAKLWSGKRLKKHDPKSIVPAAKHGGENVKRWHCLSSSSDGNLIFIGSSMKGEIYRDILQRNLVDSVKNLNLNQGRVMQHDNDPKHRAYTITK